MIPLSCRSNLAGRYLNLIDFGMCSPAVVFIILKISHVFPRYRSIVGNTSKIARILFSVSRIFAKCIWQIFKTGFTITFPYPHPGHYTNTSGFWPRVRARTLRATVFFSSLPHQTGRCAPPPRPSQLRCLLFDPQK